MIGGGEYLWMQTDTGWIWTGPGVPPGCGPGCCGGCKTQPGQRLFGFPVENNADKFNHYSHYSQRVVPDILSSYVTKQELQDALNEFRGVCEILALLGKSGTPESINLTWQI